MSESSENLTLAKEEKFSRLPKNPETQAKINQMFTESGIVQKAVHALMNPRPTNWKYPVRVEDCNFGVHKGPKWRGEGEETDIVVEFPNPDPEQRDHLPRPEMNVGFDVEGQPGYIGYKLSLDPSQGQVVQDALKLQEAETAK